MYTLYVAAILFSRSSLHRESLPCLSNRQQKQFKISVLYMYIFLTKTFTKHKSGHYKLEALYAQLFLTTARQADITKKDGGGDWKYICACATSKLQEVCKMICNGDIFMHDLRLLCDKKGQMHKLCLAATVDGKPQYGIPSADAVIFSLNQRLKEYEQFEEYRKQLKNILPYFTSVRLQGKTHYNTLVFGGYLMILSCRTRST